MGPGPISGDREPPLRKMLSVTGAGTPRPCPQRRSQGHLCTEVGDFFHEFERLILIQYEEHPERAREIFMNIDDILSRRIIELERRKESLRKLREKIRTLLMLEGDPETPWPSQVPSGSNRGSPSPLREARGRECSVKV